MPTVPFFNLFNCKFLITKIILFWLQVEAALTSDPECAELLKLKEDLVQVIDLTTELISAQGEGPSEGSSSGKD